MTFRAHYLCFAQFIYITEDLWHSGIHSIHLNYLTPYVVEAVIQILIMLATTNTFVNVKYVNICLDILALACLLCLVNLSKALNRGLFVVRKTVGSLTETLFTLNIT